MKRLFLLLPAMALLALLLPAAPVRAEAEDWSATLKAFKAGFKTKLPLKTRRKAAKDLAGANDARAVKELIKVVKTQTKHTKKIFEEWESEEAAWLEKTQGYEKAIKDRGNKYTQEEDDWLGLSDKFRQRGGPRPKMYVEKARIQGLYKSYIKELELVPYILKSVARVVNGLAGDEREKAERDATSAAKRAKSEVKEHFINMLSYVIGESATSSLESFAADTSPTVAILALEAIGRQNQERGLTYLVNRLDDPRWQLRAAAIKGLSYFKDARAMDALLAAAKEEEGVVQRKFFAAMARIVQEQVPGTVEAWQSFWDDNREDFVRRWAKFPKGEPIEGEPPDIPIDTTLGSTSFYGIQTNSKHIIFIVDISGSMGPEQGGKNEQGDAPIDVARKELLKALKSMSASAEDERGASSFNIVIYSTDVTVYKPGKMVTVTKPSKVKANKWIEEQIKATAQTNIYDAIEQAFNIISASSDAKNLKKGADTIFLMTDGQPTRGKFIDIDLILREVKEMNKTRKITLHTIGVGPGHDRSFLSRLAAQNDGQYLAR